MQSTRRIWRAGLVGAAAAAMVNLLVLVIGRLAGVDFSLVTNGGPTQVSVTAVLLMTLVTFALGTALAVLLARGGAHRLRWAQLAGAAFAVLTAGAPLSFTGGSTTGVLLALMHLVTGASYVLALQAVRSRAATTAGSPSATASR